MDDRTLQLPTPVGREIVSASDDFVVDLTVEIVPRGTSPSTWPALAVEPADKRIVRLRGDRRDAAGAPSLAYLESGCARQLAAALVRAADIVDELLNA